MQTNRFNRSASRSQIRGLSLIEACVVIALMGIVATIAAPSMQGLIEGRRIDGAATQLATDIQFARSEAVARNQGVRLSVHAGCYIVHTGAAAECACGEAGEAQCRGTARSLKTVVRSERDGIEVLANVTSMAFDPLLGTATPTGTVRVVGPHERAVHHVVNVMGRLRSCSPHAAVSGYRAC
jgi:type IV fimbrial biogenesis protein FimT